MLMDTNGHTILSEDYCSYEVAKLLKEKGFEGICDYAYSNKGNYFEIDRSNFDEVYCLRPTLQMAMKWLRMEHNILLFLLPAQENGKLVYLVEVWTWNEEEGIYEALMLLCQEKNQRKLLKQPLNIVWKT